LAAVGVVLLLMLVFWQIAWDGENPYGDNFWNIVMAYISLVLLCLILILGPVARLVPRVRRLVPWGRELGIGMFVTAGLHLLILLDGGWDILGLLSVVGVVCRWFLACGRGVPRYANCLSSPQFSEGQRHSCGVDDNQK